MKRILGILPYVLLLTALFLPPYFPASAQTDYVDGSYAEGLQAAKTGQSINSDGYVSHVKTADISDTVRRIGPPMEGVTVPVGAYKSDPKYVQEMDRQSLLASVQNATIAMIMYPPASTQLALRDIGESLGFLPHRTYAQTPGIGFAGLAPLLPVWKAFRNIAYLMLALVMIVVGFMVMLRKKIDPKTVVTVQNALPRIVTTLILVTFSYAIVGIMIDLMYLVIYLSIGIFSTTGMLTTPLHGGGEQYGTYQNLYTSAPLITIIGSIFPFDPVDGEKNKWGLISLSSEIIGAEYVPIQGNVVQMIEAVITDLKAFVGKVVVAPLVALILCLAVLFIMIRIFIIFLNSYISVILSLVIGPFQILMEAVPGSNGFSGWFKNLLANLSVFPVASAMFMLATVFNHAAGESSAKIWAPTGTGFGFSNTSISAMFTLGILFSVPGVCGSIKQALKAKSPINTGPGALLAPITTTAGAAMGTAGQFYYTSSMFGQVKNLFPGGKSKTQHP